jgi:hypothetical protein
VLGLNGAKRAGEAYLLIIILRLCTIRMVLQDNNDSSR